MSLIDRLRSWVTGTPPQRPEPPPRPLFVPEPTESFVPSYADPAVETLTETMLRGQGEWVANRLRKQAVGLQVAQSQTGLPGIALQLARMGSDTEERASLGEAALQHLHKGDPAGPWKHGAALAGTSGYAAARWAACQETLAAGPIGLPALGLRVMQAIPSNTYGEERAAAGRKALELIGSDNARLALKAAGTSGYQVPQSAIYETFLADPEGEPCALGLRALEKIPLQTYAEERADAAEQIVSGLSANRPALAMALAASRTSGYQVPRRILLEAGLENAEVRKPQELAGLGLAMVRAVPANTYGEEAAAAADAVLKTLSQHAELAPVTSLARTMMGTSSYQTPQRAIADRMLEAAALGSSPAQAARAAFEAIPVSNYAEEAAAAALAALKTLRGSSPVADMAVKAMESGSYTTPHLAIARVAFQALTADEAPPLAVTALAMLEAVPVQSYCEEAVAAGRALAAHLAPRYSGAREALDRARQGDGDREHLQRLKAALTGLKGLDDDRAEILKMAQAVQAKSQPVTIEQRPDAIVVGGVRVKRRPSDATAPRA